MTCAGPGSSLHRLAGDVERHAAAAGGQPLLLEFGLLHQPVRDAAVERDMRAAALEAARPEPALVGQEHADAAFALAVEQQQRPLVGTLHDDLALGPVDADEAEPAAPVRRLAGRAVEAARHRMALAEVGQARVEGLVDDLARSAWPAGPTSAASWRSTARRHIRGRRRSAARRPFPHIRRCSRNRGSAARRGAGSGRR